MTRPKKQTVDYFPHMANHKTTMFVLEQKYGNDGYAFWFKLLEMMAAENGHYIDCKNTHQWEFLQAKTRINEEKCTEILNLLSKLGAIDKELWTEKIIWSENFIHGISSVYKNRGVEIPSKPSFYPQKPQDHGVSTSDNPQSIVKESIVNKAGSVFLKETPEGPSSPPIPRPPSQVLQENFNIFWKAYPKKMSKGQAEKSWQKLSPNEQLTAQILQAVERAKKSDSWLKDSGKYIPYPATWLNAKGWEDEPLSDSKESFHEVFLK